MRYRKINNKGSVLREPLSTAVHIKLKIGAVRFYVRFSSADIFLRLLHAKSLYLKYPLLQSEPLPLKSHRKDKFWNLSTGMRTTMCSLKTL